MANGEGYYLAEVLQKASGRVIEHVCPAASLEGAESYERAFWRPGDGFEVLSVRLYVGGSVGNTDPA